MLNLFLPLSLLGWANYKVLYFPLCQNQCHKRLSDRCPWFPHSQGSISQGKVRSQSQIYSSCFRGSEWMDKWHPHLMKRKLCSLVLAFTIQKVRRPKVRAICLSTVEEKDTDDMCIEILKAFNFLFKNRKSVSICHFICELELFYFPMCSIFNLTIYLDNHLVKLCPIREKNK